MARSGQHIAVVFNRLDAISAEARVRTRNVTQRAVHDIAAHMTASFSGPKSGAMYGSHRASAPGEAPAIDTGALAASVASRMIGPTSGEVSVSQEHAMPLEMGTHKMAARPFAQPAAHAVAPSFFRAMKAIA